MDISSSPLVKNLPHIIGLAVLVLVLLFVLVNFGYLRCCDIPGFCDVYYGIKGYPKIAIVFGDNGIGDPQALHDVIVQRKHQFADMIPLENLVSTGLLDKYALVIVEHAKTMETPTFYVFRDYVQKGGKLLWIGDAGTGLVKGKDYVCEKITFTYLPATNYTSQSMKYTGNVLKPDGTTVSAGDLAGFPREPGATLPAGYSWETTVASSTGAQCAPEWVEESPDVPEELKGGICGSSFSDIVLKYIAAKQEINETLRLSGTFFCPSEKEALKIEGAEKEQKCIDYLKSKGIKESEIIASDIIRECAYSSGYPYGFSNWKRGPSTTLTGTKLESIDFGAVVLGLDFVGSQYAGSSQTANLFLQPTDVSHRLVRGYEAKTKWFGTAAFCMTDISRYSIRTAAVMNLVYNAKVWPAVAVSSPVGPLLTKTGLVVYYAFPPEIGATPESTALGTPARTGNVVETATGDVIQVEKARIIIKGQSGPTTGWSWKDPGEFTTLLKPEFYQPEGAKDEYSVDELTLASGQEWQTESVREARGMGLNLIDNLIDFTLCK